eukprot:3506-Heterococcus_DN1.PRE.1
MTTMHAICEAKVSQASMTTVHAACKSALKHCYYIQDIVSEAANQAPLKAPLIDRVNALHMLRAARSYSKQRPITAPSAV